MTHVPNFAHERLAMFLFPSLFEFLSCWTNLKFFSLPPLDIVQKYFEFNPEDNEPIWTVNKIFKNFIFLLFLKFVFFLSNSRIFVTSQVNSKFGKRKAESVVGYRKL